MTTNNGGSARFPWMRAGLSLLLCIGVLGAGFALSSQLAAMKEQPQRRKKPEKIYSIQAFAVESADLQEIITAFGTTRPSREVTIDAQVAGEVTMVHDYREQVGPSEGPERGLKVGQRVRAAEPVPTANEASLDPGAKDRFQGDLLLQIDDSTYRERVAQAQNRINEDLAELKRLRQEQVNSERLLAKVKSDFEIYEKQYARVKRLYDRKIATESELSSAKLELARYEDAKIKQENDNALFPNRIELQNKKILTHKTDLELAKLDVDRTNIRPPFSGVISEVMVELGKYVNVGEPLLRLTDTSEIEIPLPLALYDYAKIERRLLAGEMPRVELSENETAPKRWVGHVVRHAPEADVNTRTVEVYVLVDNHGAENSQQAIDLLPSVFVHARVDGPVIKQAIVVPRDVVRNEKVFVIGNLKKAPAATDDKVAQTGIAMRTESGGEVSEGIVEVRNVDVVRSLRNLAIVSIESLKPGEFVAMTNLDVIHTGAKVRIESQFSLNDALHEQGTPALRRYDPSGKLAGGPGKDEGESPN